MTAWKPIGPETPRDRRLLIKAKGTGLTHVGGQIYEHASGYYFHVAGLGLVPAVEWAEIPE